MRKLMVTASMVAGLTVGLVGAAEAQTDCHYPENCDAGSVDPSVLPVDPEELPAVVESAGLPGVQVKGKQQLPVTGTDAAGMAAIGAVLIGGGGLLVWRSRGADAEA